MRLWKSQKSSVMKRQKKSHGLMIEKTIICLKLIIIKKIEIIFFKEFKFIYDSNLNQQM